MTDLERAQVLITDALAAARQEGYLEAAKEYLEYRRQVYERGAAEMRERIAVELAATSPYYARLVRALPLTPEEPV